VQVVDASTPLGPCDGAPAASAAPDGGAAAPGDVRPAATPAGEYPEGIHFVAASTANYDRGRAGRSISMVVIHDMEGHYDAAISWFQNPAAQASAHYAIRSADGDTTQMINEEDTAWHAGNLDVNERSIGIEHEGFLSDPATWYTDARAGPPR
jgi:N-acetyl-anhydromuramyl-L-alanine amidase AmpD